MSRGTLSDASEKRDGQLPALGRSVAEFRILGGAMSGAGPLDLGSSRWSQLAAYAGTAEDLPALLRQFRQNPDLKAFDKLRIRLTGDGDIRESEAFYAALPHIVGVLSKIQQQPREEMIGQLAWAAAVAAGAEPPRGLREAYSVALEQLAELAVETLRHSKERQFRTYLLAAIAVGVGEPNAALAIVNLDASLCCPRCGHLIDCPSCGLPLLGRASNTESIQNGDK